MAPDTTMAGLFCRGCKMDGTLLGNLSFPGVLEANLHTFLPRFYCLWKALGMAKLPGRGNLSFPGVLEANLHTFLPRFYCLWKALGMAKLPGKIRHSKGFRKQICTPFFPGFTAYGKPLEWRSCPLVGSFAIPRVFQIPKADEFRSGPI